MVRTLQINKINDLSSSPSQARKHCYNAIAALRASAELAIFGLREAISAMEAGSGSGEAAARALRAVEGAEAALESFDRRDLDGVPVHGWVEGERFSREPIEEGRAVVLDTDFIAEREAGDGARRETERLSAIVSGSYEEVRLLGAGPKGGGFGFDLAGGPVPYIAEYLAEMLGYKGDRGLANYVEIEVGHRKIGPMTLTLQRRSGKTAHQLRLEAETELARVRADGRTTA